MEKEWITLLIDELAKISSGEKGVTRLAFSAEDFQARSYIKAQMLEAGLSVRTDAFGNIIGRYEGSDPAAPAVVTGSHLDSVPSGGKYDGVLGVVGGLAALKRLRDEALTHPQELIVFQAEESSRFNYSTMGSKAMTGLANPTAWKKAKDHDGAALVDVLAGQGIDLTEIGKAARAKDEIKAFVELHIEQGPVLERTDNAIGIVAAIAAPTRLKITVEGIAGHSGTTPMDSRQDALVSAAMIILAVREIALEHHHEGTVGTVGVCKVFPNAMNVIPSHVELSVDIRGTEQESIIETIQDIKDAISSIADEMETPVAIDVIAADRPVALDSGIIDIIEEACLKQGISYKIMNSGAGHDSMNMASLAPTGMIFIPCREGISHNPEEYASPEDILRGVDVLTATLRALAK